jgi:hypothetical protein
MHVLLPSTLSTQISKSTQGSRQADSSVPIRSSMSGQACEILLKKKAFNFPLFADGIEIVRLVLFQLHV